MTTTARRLESMITAVEADKACADMERRHALARTHNAKAQRLVARLQQCDQSLATLLSEAAGCLEAFVATSGGPSSRVDRGAPSNDFSQDAELRLQDFEARAQEWFATLHDVQLGLRSAVRNLRKAQRVPIAHDTTGRGAGGQAAANLHPEAALGSATKGHSLALVLSNPALDSESSDEGSQVNTPLASRRSSGEHTMRPGQQGSTQSKHHDLLSRFIGDDMSDRSSLAELQDEATLSLSALRLQDDSWRQLEESLQALAAEKRYMRGKGLADADIDRMLGDKAARGALTRTRVDGNALTSAQATQLGRDIVERRVTRDTRLIDAVLHLNMEMLPETAISPMRGPAPQNVVL